MNAFKEIIFAKTKGLEYIYHGKYIKSHNDNWRTSDNKYSSGVKICRTWDKTQLVSGAVSLKSA